MKLQDAPTIRVTAKGMKLTPRLLARTSAMGYMKAAEATLVMRVSMMMQPTKMAINAIIGLSPPIAPNPLAMIDDRPVALTADSIPIALAITTKVEKSMLAPALFSGRHPLRISRPLANRAALSILIHPIETTTTIATVIRVAPAALSRRWMCSSVMRRVIENSVSFRFS